MEKAPKKAAPKGPHKRDDNASNNAQVGSPFIIPTTFFTPRQMKLKQQKDASAVAASSTPSAKIKADDAGQDLPTAKRRRGRPSKQKVEPIAELNTPYIDSWHANMGVLPKLDLEADPEAIRKQALEAALDWAKEELKFYEDQIREMTQEATQPSSPEPIKFDLMDWEAALTKLLADDFDAVKDQQAETKSDAAGPPKHRPR